MRWTLYGNVAPISRSSVAMRKFGRFVSIDPTDMRLTLVQVDREVAVDETGNVSTQRILSPYDRPDIPEPFLVVRT